MARVTIKTVRNALLVIWFAGFALNLTSVLYLGLGNWIAEDNFRRALTQLNASYVPYLGVITAFCFAANGRTKSRAMRNNVAPALALATSLLWNVAILAMFVPLLYSHGVIEESIKNAEFFSGLVSWLVAPAIGFYFARTLDRMESTSPTRAQQGL